MDAVLKVRDLGISFGGNVVLKSINFEVGEAEVLGIMGPNGAGKTVLLNIISGILKAAYEGNLASSIMRKGLFNKLGEILALILGKLVEYASMQYQLGFSIPLPRLFR